MIWLRYTRSLAECSAQPNIAKGYVQWRQELTMEAYIRSDTW